MNKPYRDYLKSDKWAKKRQKILKRDNYQCVRCGSDSRLQVHHLNYDNIFDEEQSDLITVCGFCHALIHGVIEPSPDYEVDDIKVLG